MSIPKSHWFADKFGAADYGKCRFCGKDVRDRDSVKPCPARNNLAEAKCRVDDTEDFCFTHRGKASDCKVEVPK